MRQTHIITLESVAGPHKGQRVVLPIEAAAGSSNRDILAAFASNMAHAADEGASIAIETPSGALVLGGDFLRSGAFYAYITVSPTAQA